MTSVDTMRFDGGIAGIDTGFLEHGWSGVSYLVQHGGAAAIIDPGPATSTPQVLAGLQSLQVTLEEIAYIVVTHVHLDHAGAAGILAQQLPDAQVVCHAQAVEHLVAPEILAAATESLFGTERFNKFFGTPVPVPTEQMLGVTDGDELSVGGRSLAVMETPGHATHHICLLDKQSDNLFAGDALGYSYLEANVEGRAFAMPATPPPDYSPDAMLRTMDRILALAPSSLCLGHGAKISNIKQWDDDLRRLLDAQLSLARKFGNRRNAERLGPKLLLEMVAKDWQASGCKLFTSQVEPLCKWDAWVNWRGLTHWLNHR